MYYLVYVVDDRRITEYFPTEKALKSRVNLIFDKVTGLHFGIQPRDYERKNR